MIMDLVIVKKAISFGSSYPVIRTGVHKKENIIKYPFDLNNKEYFDIITYTPIPDGTKVIYNGSSYYTKFNPNDFTAKVNNKFSTKKIDVSYKLVKNINDEKPKTITVFESNFDICTFYFFINSEGSICQAFDGQKPNADAFRKRVGNYFNTKEDARKLLDEVFDCDIKVELFKITYTK